MAQLYLNNPKKNNENTGSRKPKKETIAFLLNYSKALRVVGKEDEKYEFIVN